MKGKGHTLLIGFGAPEGGPGGGDYDDHQAKVDAAEELIDAVKGGDAEAVAEAFRVMYDLCADGGGYDDEMM